MPKLRLWNPTKGNDFNFIDRQVREIFDMSGTGINVHKYIGPKTPGATQTTIQDVVFMENRSRKYDDTIFELKGTYSPDNPDFDLTQFGLFLSSDTIFIEFHTTDMVDRIGRKLMSGDVLELPHLREVYTLTEDAPAFNKFFSVEDAYRSSTGYGPKWWSHIWRVKAKIISGGEEFSDILGKSSVNAGVDANGNPIVDQSHSNDLINIISSYNIDLDNTARIQQEAACDMPYDAPFYSGFQYYIHKDADGIPMVYQYTGQGKPPNGFPLKGSGTEFPDNLQDGDYFLRTDFKPFPFLFLKAGCKFTKIELDVRKTWTGANQLLDTFIDNTDTYVDSPGVVKKQKQALSKVVRPRDGS